MGSSVSNRDSIAVRKRFEELSHRTVIIGDDLAELLDLPDEVATSEEWQAVLVKVRLSKTPVGLHMQFANKFKRHAPAGDLSANVYQIAEICINSVDDWETSELASHLLGLVTQLINALEDNKQELLELLWNNRQSVSESAQRYSVRAEFVTEIALALSFDVFGIDVCEEAINSLSKEEAPQFANSRTRLGIRLFRFLTLTGKASKGLEWLATLEQDAEKGENADLLDLLFTLKAQTAFQLERWDEARTATEKAVEFAEGNNNLASLAAHMANLSVIEEKLGNLEKAIHWRSRLVEDKRLHQQDDSFLLDLFALASLLDSKGDSTKALAHFEDLAMRVKKSENFGLRGAIQSRIARICAGQDDLVAATDSLLKSLTDYRQTDDVNSTMTVLLALSEIYEMQGDGTKANSFKKEALELSKDLRA